MHCRHCGRWNLIEARNVARSMLFCKLLVCICVWQLARAEEGPLVAKSGRELYQQFCASCHGSSGRGDGPVAGTLRVEVPDLTRLANRQGGTFDRARVERVIDGRYVIAAHGRRTMPIWGEEISKAHVGDPDAERAARVVVGRLADYVWQLQKPAPAPAPR